MSEQDRERWDVRYGEGAYATRAHPSAFLAEQIERFAPGPALDIACGAGRNAVFLAAHGFDVDAIDVSTVGLDIAQRRASAAGVTVNWLNQDLLESPDIPREDYALIVMFRFVAPDLLRTLPNHLAHGGYLVVEEHLRSKVDVVGPRGDRFRLAEGELEAALPGLEVEFCSEGLVTEPDGRQAALARIIARNAPRN